jgi:type II secretory pathway predicted ATPase ExeA
MHRLKSQAAPAKISCPSVGHFDVLKLAASAHKLKPSFSNQDCLLTTFKSFLRESFSCGKKPVLIIDEAQSLTLENLTELWHLSNFGENDRKWLNLVFVGQNEFDDILSQESHNALKEKVIFRYKLPPLTLEETRKYVLHRLRIARGERETSTTITQRVRRKYTFRLVNNSPEEILTTEALKEVFLFSRGIPRLINNICDHALLDAYLEGRKTIQPHNIQKCAQKFQLSTETAGCGGKEPSVSYSMERKPGEPEGGDIRCEPGPRTVRWKSGRRWVPSFCSTAVLFVVFFAILFLFNKSAPLLHTLIYPVFKEASRNDIVSSTRIVENPFVKGPHAVLSSVARGLATSESPEGNFDVGAPQEVTADPDPSVQSTAREEISVGVIETERHGTADSSTSAEPAKWASTDPRLEDKSPSALKEGFLKHYRASWNNEKERGSHSPGSKIEPTLPESTFQKAKEREPGRVIEWLLERKSHQASGDR